MTQQIKYMCYFLNILIFHIFIVTYNNILVNFQVTLCPSLSIQLAVSIESLFPKVLKSPYTLYR